MICGVSETATNPQCGPRHKKADVTRKYFTKCSEGLSVTIKDDQGREYREKAAQTQLSEVVDELGMQSDLIVKDIDAVRPLQRCKRPIDRRLACLSFRLQ